MRSGKVGVGFMLACLVCFMECGVGEVTRSAGMSRRLQETFKCRGAVDMVFVLDGSGSVLEPNWQKELLLASNVTEAFNIGKGQGDSRIGVVPYSSGSPSASLVIKLDRYFSANRLKEAIQSIEYPTGGTYTGKALDYTTTTLFTPSGGARDTTKGVPRVIVVVTDGQSTDSVDAPSKRARDAGISIFSIGVGAGVNRTQLLAMALVPEHVFVVDDFASFDPIVNTIKEETCKEPATVLNDSSVVTDVGKDEVRYFKVPLTPGDGDVCIWVDDIRGSTDVLSSRRERNPGEGAGQSSIYLSSKTLESPHKEFLVSDPAAIPEASATEGLDPPRPKVPKDIVEASRLDWAGNRRSQWQRDVAHFDPTTCLPLPPPRSRTVRAQQLSPSIRPPFFAYVAVIGTSKGDNTFAINATAASRCKRFADPDPSNMYQVKVDYGEEAAKGGTDGLKEVDPTADADGGLFNPDVSTRFLFSTPKGSKRTEFVIGARETARAWGALGARLAAALAVVGPIWVGVVPLLFGIAWTLLQTRDDHGPEPDTTGPSVPNPLSAALSSASPSHDDAGGDDRKEKDEEEGEAEAKFEDEAAVAAAGATTGATTWDGKEVETDTPRSSSRKRLNSTPTTPKGGGGSGKKGASGKPTNTQSGEFVRVMTGVRGLASGLDGFSGRMVRGLTGQLNWMLPKRLLAAGGVVLWGFTHEMLAPWAGASRRAVEEATAATRAITETPAMGVLLWAQAITAAAGLVGALRSQYLPASFGGDAPAFALLLLSAVRPTEHTAATSIIALLLSSAARVAWFTTVTSELAPRPYDYTTREAPYGAENDASSLSNRPKTPNQDIWDYSSSAQLAAGGLQGAAVAGVVLASLLLALLVRRRLARAWVHGRVDRAAFGALFSPLAPFPLAYFAAFADDQADALGGGVAGPGCLPAEGAENALPCQACNDRRARPRSVSEAQVEEYGMRRPSGPTRGAAVSFALAGSMGRRQGEDDIGSAADAALASNRERSGSVVVEPTEDPWSGCTAWAAACVLGCAWGATMDAAQLRSAAGKEARRTKGWLAKTSLLCSAVTVPVWGCLGSSHDASSGVRPGPALMRFTFHIAQLLFLVSMSGPYASTGVPLHAAGVAVAAIAGCWFVSPVLLLLAAAASVSSISTDRIWLEERVFPPGIGPADEVEERLCLLVASTAALRALLAGPALGSAVLLILAGTGYGFGIRGEVGSEASRAAAASRQGAMVARDPRTGGERTTIQDRCAAWNMACHATTDTREQIEEEEDLYWIDHAREWCRRIARLLADRPPALLGGIFGDGYAHTRSEDGGLPPDPLEPDWALGWSAPDAYLALRHPRGKDLNAPGVGWRDLGDGWGGGTLRWGVVARRGKDSKGDGNGAGIALHQDEEEGERGGMMDPMAALRAWFCSVGVSGNAEGDIHESSIADRARRLTAPTSALLPWATMVATEPALPGALRWRGEVLREARRRVRWEEARARRLRAVAASGATSSSAVARAQVSLPPLFTPSRSVKKRHLIIPSVPGNPVPNVAPVFDAILALLGWEDEDDEEKREAERMEAMAAAGPKSRAWVAFGGAMAASVVRIGVWAGVAALCGSIAPLSVGMQASTGMQLHNASLPCAYFSQSVNHTTPKETQFAASLATAWGISPTVLTPAFDLDKDWTNADYFCHSMPPYAIGKGGVKHVKSGTSNSLHSPWTVPRRTSSASSTPTTTTTKVLLRRTYQCLSEQGVGPGSGDAVPGWDGSGGYMDTAEGELDEYPLDAGKFEWASGAFVPRAATVYPAPRAWLPQDHPPTGIEMLGAVSWVFLSTGSIPLISIGIAALAAADAALGEWVSAHRTLSDITSAFSATPLSPKPDAVGGESWGSEGLRRAMADVPVIRDALDALIALLVIRAVASLLAVGWPGFGPWCPRGGPFELWKFGCKTKADGSEWDDAGTNPMVRVEGVDTSGLRRGPGGRKMQKRVSYRPRAARVEKMKDGEEEDGDGDGGREFKAPSLTRSTTNEEEKEKKGGGRAGLVGLSDLIAEEEEAEAAWEEDEGDWYEEDEWDEDEEEEEEEEEDEEEGDGEEV